LTLYLPFVRLYSIYFKADSGLNCLLLFDCGFIRSIHQSDSLYKQKDRLEGGERGERREGGRSDLREGARKREGAILNLETRSNVATIERRSRPMPSLVIVSARLKTSCSLAEPSSGLVQRSKKATFGAKLANLNEGKRATEKDEIETTFDEKTRIRLGMKNE
jgi:hypothetical protein